MCTVSLHYYLFTCVFKHNGDGLSENSKVPFCMIYQLQIGQLQYAVTKSYWLFCGMLFAMLSNGKRCTTLSPYDIFPTFSSETTFNNYIMLINLATNCLPPHTPTVSMAQFRSHIWAILLTPTPSSHCAQIGATQPLL